MNARDRWTWAPGIIPAILFSAGALLAALTGCDDYDPPPEPELKSPAQGQWLPDTPLRLEFSEPIDEASLVLSIWPVDLGPEGELSPDAEPVVPPCAPALESCEPVEVELSEDGTRAVIHQNGTFVGREGKPHFVRVAAGLRDRQGRTRRVSSRFSFQVTPPIGEGAIDLSMNTGVMTITSDLTEVVPGIYLRMFMDTAVCQETGRITLVATVAGKTSDAANNTTDPAEMYAKINDEGWTVLLEGQVTELEDGNFYLTTEPADLDVKVLGFIRVQLLQLELEATITPGDTAEGARDRFEGILRAEEAYMGDDLSPLNNGERVVADWEGFGVWEEEIDPGLPRVDDDAPCADLIEGGGDCQLPQPWSPGVVCE
ncbi:MAG: hypothetical protein ACQEXJ_02280 [Myxococcota bacterium]